MFLNNPPKSKYAIPCLVINWFGYDINDPSDGIRTIQGRHRATDHFNAFNCFHRRDKSGFKTAAAVWSGFPTALTSSIDQNQRVIAT